MNAHNTGGKNTILTADFSVSLLIIVKDQGGARSVTY